VYHLKVDFNAAERGLIRSLQRLSNAPGDLVVGDEIILYDGEGTFAVGVVERVRGTVITARISEASGETYARGWMTAERGTNAVPGERRQRSALEVSTQSDPRWVQPANEAA
jgi:hypothetical protein